MKVRRHERAVALWCLAGVLALLALAAEAAPRREWGWRARGLAAAERASSGLLLNAPLGGDCDGAAPGGVTYTRASSAFCTRADGTLVSLGTNVPRTESRGLLVEAASTNLMLRSQEADHASWSRTSISVTADTHAAPDGTTTADTLTGATSAGRVEQYVVVTGTSVTGSAYVRAVSGTQSARLTVYNVTAGADVCNAAFTATTTWQRVSCSGTLTSGNTVGIALYPSNTGSAGVLVVWGMQQEALPFATSYVPTAGTSAQRTVATASATTPATLSTAEGCARICITPLQTGAASNLRLFLYANTGSGAARFFYANATQTVVRAWNGTSIVQVEADFTAGQPRCYVTDWSVTGSFLRITNTTSGASNTDATFTGFPTLPGLVLVGDAATEGPPNARLSDVRFGSAPGRCL